MSTFPVYEYVLPIFQRLSSIEIPYDHGSISSHPVPSTPISLPSRHALGHDSASPPPGHELDLQGFGNVACAPENILKRIVFCTIDVA